MDQKESASKTPKGFPFSLLLLLVWALAVARLWRGSHDWRLVLANVMFVCVVLMIAWNQNAAMRRAKNISESIVSKHQKEPGATTIV
jgi:hypothetical protein